MFLPLLLKGALPPTQIDAFVLHPNHGIEKICAYNRAWLDYLERRSDCLIVTYEEMRAAPAEGFQKILDFFGETGVSGQHLADTATFERMKAAEKEKKSTILSQTKSNDPDSAKVRKGKVRGYVEELKSESAAECHRIAAAYGFEDGV